MFVFFFNPCARAEIASARAPEKIVSGHLKVSASLTNVKSLVVGALDLVNFSLSVVGFVPVSKCRTVVVGLWATLTL